MDKAALEAHASDLQRRHKELQDESLRVEGEFRLTQNLLSKLAEAEAEDGGEKEDQAVDAQDQLDSASADQ